MAPARCWMCGSSNVPLLRVPEKWVRKPYPLICVQPCLRLGKLLWLPCRGRVSDTAGGDLSWRHEAFLLVEPASSPQGFLRLELVTQRAPLALVEAQRFNVAAYWRVSGLTEWLQTAPRGFPGNPVQFTMRVTEVDIFSPGCSPTAVEAQRETELRWAQKSPPLFAEAQYSWQNSTAYLDVGRVMTIELPDEGRAQLSVWLDHMLEQGLLRVSL